MMDPNSIFLRIVRGAPPNALTVADLTPEEWAAAQPLFAEGKLALARQGNATYVHAISFAAAADALREAGEMDIAPEAIQRLGEREGHQAFESGEPFNEGGPESVRVGWKHASMIVGLHPSAAI